MFILLRRHTPAAGLYTFIAILMLTSCSNPPDEQIIIQHIESMAINVQQRNVSGTLEQFSESFSATHLNTKKDVKRMLMLSFFKYKRIAILITNIQVSIDNIYTNQAEATFNAITTSGSGLIPNEGQAYRINTKWEKNADDWYLVEAEWKRAFE